MKTSQIYEIIAVVCALSGILLLGFVCYPQLNPKQFALTHGPQIADWQRYVWGPVVAGGLLLVGWYFNSKAVDWNRRGNQTR